MFAELTTVPQITILVHTDLGVGTRFTHPLATYQNPKLIAVWGTTSTGTYTSTSTSTTSGNSTNCSSSCSSSSSGNNSNIE